MKKMLFILLALVCAGNANAESTKTAKSTTKIYRSHSGGSGMVDVVRKTSSDDQKTVAADTTQERAMISEKALQQMEPKKKTHHVPLSRSGGSGMAVYSELPKN